MTMEDIYEAYVEAFFATYQWSLPGKGLTIVISSDGNHMDILLDDDIAFIQDLIDQVILGEE